jgi:hypothetical protein
VAVILSDAALDGAAESKDKAFALVLKIKSPKGFHLRGLLIKSSYRIVPGVQLASTRP